MNNRVIDKNKKSNRRCINCQHYTIGENHDMYNGCSCDITGATKNYWNCCSEFSWKSGKKYKKQ